MTIDKIKRTIASTIPSHETIVNKRGDYCKITVMLPFGSELVGFFSLNWTIDFESIARQCAQLEGTNVANGLFIMDCSKIILARSFEGYQMAEITIPGSVDYIFNGAFRGCTNLRKVVVSDGVRFIGPEVFRDCNNLRIVDIADSVEEIRDYAFSGCTALKGVKLPAKLDRVSEYMFSECGSLETIDIPDKVCCIDYCAFQKCSSLQKVNIPTSVYKIDNEAFKECASLKDVIIPTSVDEIGDKAFYGCSSIRNITLPPSVTSIGQAAFSKCTSLESVSIANGVKKIPDDMFAGCSSLKTVSLPDSLKSIGADAFSECTSLVTLKLPPSLEEIRCNAFGGCTSLMGITLLDGLKKIGNDAFRGCRSICSIKIPSSVTELGYRAFWDTSIQKPIIHNKVLSYVPANTNGRFVVPKGVVKIDVETFKGTDITEIVFSESVREIRSSAFEGCKLLREVTLPYKIKEIQNRVFANCLSLQNVTLPQRLTSIGQYAFANCAIQHLEIPSKVTHIYQGAFSGCRSLIEVDMAKATQIYQVGWGAFGDCPSVTTVHTPKGLPWSKLKDRFRESPWSKQRPVKVTVAAIKRQKLIELENASYKSIVQAAVAPHYAHITLDANSIKVIAELANNSYIVTELPLKDHDGNKIPVVDFKCEELKKLVAQANPETTYWLYPHGTIITQDMTLWAKVVTGVTKNVVLLPGITQIGESAFEGFRELQRIYIPQTVKTIDLFAFLDTDLIEPVIVDGVLFRAPVAAINGTYTIPEGVHGIHSSAFEGCRTLEEVIIPKGVTLVEGYAFSKCTSLKRVVFQDPVRMYIKNSTTTEPLKGYTLIYNTVFHLCPSLKEFVVPNKEELLSQLVLKLSNYAWI